MAPLLGATDALRLAAQFVKFNDIPTDAIVATSYLGTPIYDQLIFPAEGNEEIELSEDFALSDIIIQVSRPKVIITTPIQGREGDVNEFISNGDYRLTIRGFLVSEDQLVQPVEQLTTLNNIASFPGAVAVASGFLNVFQIESLVIDEFDIGQIAGYRNELPFSMTCRSEQPIELQLQGSSNAST